MRITDLLHYNKSGTLATGMAYLFALVVCLILTLALLPDLLHSLTQQQKSQELSTWLAPTVVLFFIAGCLHFFFHFAATKFQIQGAYRMRQEFLYILSQSPFDQFNQRDEKARLLQEPIDLLWMNITALCWNLPYTVLLLVVLMGLIASMSSGFFVVICGVVLFYGAVHQWQNHRLFEFMQRRYHTRHLLQRKFDEFIACAQSMKLLSLEERALQRMEHTCAESSLMEWVQWSAQLTKSTAYFVALAAGLTTVWITQLPTGEGGHTGTVLSLMLYTSLAISVVAHSESYLTHWNHLQTVCRLLQPWLSWQPPNDAPQIIPPAGPIPVEVDRAAFTYPDASQPALQAFTMTIAPGECVAVRGDAGSGKSTLLNLIAGLHAPSHGSVRACGVETFRLDPSHWLHRTGVLPSRIVLFSSTLAENIAGAESKADAYSILRAAGAAGLHPLITRLEQGLATRISDGDARIRESERLRIGLARLFMRPYSLLLLDEPAAKLGVNARKKILPVLAELMKNKTVCLCSNLPDIVALAERVVTLTKGDIAVPEQAFADSTADSEQTQEQPLPDPTLAQTAAQHASLAPESPGTETKLDAIPELTAVTTNAPPPAAADSILAERPSVVCESAQRFYQSGKNLLDSEDPQVVSQGIELIKEAAKMGFAPAQDGMGMLYETGFGVEKNPQLAARYYHAAAENGYAPAQSNFGVMLENGWGVEQDWERAKFWYQRAAEQGDSKAQNNLGVLILRYSDSGGNDHEAAYWFDQAAQQGNTSAMYNLGMLYEESPLWHKDLRLACHWFLRAAALGHANARKRLELLSHVDLPN